MQTYSNLGDSLVAAADALCDLGRAEEGRREYGRGMEAYSAACGMSSSEAGDDLPGLLYNWGVGLHSAGTHLNVCPLPPSVCLSACRSNLDAKPSSAEAEAAYSDFAQRR